MGMCNQPTNTCTPTMASTTTTAPLQHNTPHSNTNIRFGHWEELLAQPTPPRDARGVTAYGGPQFALVVHHTGRLLALAAKAHAATQQLLGLHDVTAFDLARKSV